MNRYRYEVSNKVKSLINFANKRRVKTLEGLCSAYELWKEQTPASFRIPGWYPSKLWKRNDIYLSEEKGVKKIAAKEDIPTPGEVAYKTLENYLKSCKKRDSIYVTKQLRNQLDLTYQAIVRGFKCLEENSIIKYAGHHSNKDYYTLVKEFDEKQGKWV